MRGGAKLHLHGWGEDKGDPRDARATADAIGSPSVSRSRFLLPPMAERFQRDVGTSRGNAQREREKHLRTMGNEAK